MKRLTKEELANIQSEIKLQDGDRSIPPLCDRIIAELFKHAQATIDEAPLSATDKVMMQTLKDYQRGVETFKLDLAARFTEAYITTHKLSPLESAKDGLLAAESLIELLAGRETKPNEAPMDDADKALLKRIKDAQHAVELDALNEMAAERKQDHKHQP